MYTWQKHKKLRNQEGRKYFFIAMYTDELWRLGGVDNLFITGISRNSSSRVLGINPMRHWLEKEKEWEREKGRASICFHTHNGWEEVWGDRGLDQHSHKHTHKQRKCEADSGPNALPIPSPGFDGLTMITIEAGASYTHTLTQTMDLCTGDQYFVFSSTGCV